MRTHIVQKGETLWRIAKHYGIGLDELKRLNAHLANPDYIVPGMEIVLPESATATATGTATGTKATMTKEQLTAPVAPAAPVAPKVVETAPKAIMTKEQLTAPVKEVPKAIETAPIPAPIPAPMPVPPQFNFDFAPQMHFPQPQMQPQPMPMPMPQPQPIFIELPQQPMPMPQQVQQVQQVVEKEVEKEIEFVPVPQPHIIYVPFIPHPHCHHPCEFKHHFHHQSPCGCEQPYFNPQSLCGCHEPQPVNYDCGCQGGGYEPQMMPYNMQYFEPNYDVSQVMNTSFQEDEGLPDWLVSDSTNVYSEKTEDLNEYVMPEHYEDYGKDTNVAGVTDFSHDMNHFDHGAHPSHAYYGHYDMQQVMPQQMMPYTMPQQQMYPNCHKPYMNPYSPHYTPWKY